MSIRYTCRQELLPMIEGALAAHRFFIEPPPSERGDSICVVMTSGAAVVRLRALPKGNLAVVEIWGRDQASASQLLDSLPLALHKHVPS
jgi:hypothetical protein